MWYLRSAPILKPAAKSATNTVAGRDEDDVGGEVLSVYTPHARKNCTNTPRRVTPTMKQTPHAAAQTPSTSYLSTAYVVLS